MEFDMAETQKGDSMIDFDMIENKYKELIQKATQIMESVPDPKHSVPHMESIVKYTKEILNSGIDADPEVCVVSAYWHDVGRIEGEKGHSLLSAEMLKEELLKGNYDKDFIEKCYLAVYKHGWHDHPETIEGKVIRDADKIDFVGITRWKNCIENNCRFSKILDMLPTLRKDIFDLEISKEIYDREIGLLVRYLHDIIFENK
jgi:HD superfamily phosphodiesterase